MKKAPLLVLLAALLPLACAAEVYKCRNDQTGKIEFSGIPCDTKSSGEAINVRPNVIDTSGARTQAAYAEPERPRSYSNTTAGGGVSRAATSLSSPQRGSTCYPGPNKTMVCRPSY